MHAQGVQGNPKSEGSRSSSASHQVSVFQDLEFFLGLFSYQGPVFGIGCFPKLRIQPTWKSCLSL